VIRRLPDHLVRAIAAGEVITRPEDVLKELLENAIDAGAGRIEVEVRGGGIEKVRVTDDGVGIPEDELPLALERHATSKLTDLDRIQTLGFRGEGLFALRHAARLRLTSRPKDQLGGATVIAEGDRLERFVHPAPAGTEVEVTRLFARLPARRAALEGPGPEGRRVLQRFFRYLLHHPGLRFRLIWDGEERIAFAGGGFLAAARAVWGEVVAARLLSLAYQEGPYRLEGLLSRPELARPRRDRLLLAVNGRPVEWPEGLLAALVAAYRELLPTGQFPLGVLNLTLPAEEVLVNTDPRKERVRLLRPEEVVAFMERAVEQLLGKHPLAPALPGLRPPAGDDQRPAARFPRLTLIGSFRRLYLLAEAEEGLFVVDQHAAHERVIYEELLDRYRKEPPVELKEPLVLALSPAQMAGFWERRQELAEAGFWLEPFGQHHLRVRRVPGVFLLATERLAEHLVEMLEGAPVERSVRTILGRVACLPAVKAGHRLSRSSAQALLDALAACRTPWVCPHGRPTVLVLTELELARRFGRRSTRQQIARPAAEVGEGANTLVAEGDHLTPQEGGVAGIELEQQNPARTEGRKRPAH